MFTGSMPLEQFRREHTLEYNRLIETGELAKYLVEAPSQPMTIASTLLGLALTAIGLTLLILFVIGFTGSLLG
jgi:hypothetical protein